MKPFWTVGLMTGTSLDGDVDIALLQTNGTKITKFGPWGQYPYPEDVINILEETITAARNWNFNGQEPALFAQAEKKLTQQQAAIVLHFLKENGLTKKEITVVGFHGQTVLHNPSSPGRSPGATRQLGDGDLMARLLGIDVVFDFRSADVQAGGQGAPLAAIYHKLLLENAGCSTDTAILNLGGVGNLTWVGPEEELIAFDTGPANGPLNDWVAVHGQGKMDTDGKLAAAGNVDHTQLAALLSHPYLEAPAPKSLDRFSFTMDMAKGLSPADGAALLVAFAASAIGKALDLLPKRPEHLIVCGGGRKNPVLMENIAKYARINIEPAEKKGWHSDALEAECFAFLAARRLLNLPISFPTTTGVPRPMIGGRIAKTSPPSHKKKSFREKEEHLSYRNRKMNPGTSLYGKQNSSQHP